MLKLVAALKDMGGMQQVRPTVQYCQYILGEGAKWHGSTQGKNVMFTI
jgi:hypothetical protein